MTRSLLIFALLVTSRAQAACTLAALDWIVSDWTTAIQGTWLTVANGPGGAFRESAGDEVYSLTPLAAWRAAVPSLTVTYKVDQSLNLDAEEWASATFKIRATYTCSGGTTQYYYPPFFGSGLNERYGASWARIYSGAQGGSAIGFMYHSRSLNDNFSIITASSFGPIPDEPPTAPAAQERTTVRSAAVIGNTSVR